MQRAKQTSAYLQEPEQVEHRLLELLDQALLPLHAVAHVVEAAALGRHGVRGVAHAAAGGQVRRGVDPRSQLRGLGMIGVGVVVVEEG